MGIRLSEDENVAFHLQKIADKHTQKASTLANYGHSPNFLALLKFTILKLSCTKMFKACVVLHLLIATFKLYN